MQILFITRKYPPAIGGMETFSYGLTQALGKDCTVMYIKKRPWALLNSVWMSRRFDVIQLGDGVLTGLGVFIKKLFHKPIVVTVHGLDVTYRPKWYQTYIRWSLKRLDQVVCVSSATEQEVKKRLPLARTSVIENGVTVTDWPLNQELGKNQCLLFVGRLVKRKGCAWFIQEVLTQLPEVHLHIVGDGPERMICERLVEHYSLTKRVRFHGTVSPDQLRKHYTNAQALIMPNIVVAGDMEGFGMVAIEAGACGLPVVASRLEGIQAAVIDGKTGFLVESCNVNAWVEAIQRVLASPLDPQAIRSVIAQHYDWNHIKEQYQTLWQHFISQTNS